MFKLMLTVLLVPSLCFSQVTEQDMVNNTIKAMFEGLAKLNIEQIKNNSTDDVMILETGAIWNMDTIATKVTALRSTNFNRVNSFEFIKTEITGLSAWVAYKNKAIVSLNGQINEYNWLESAFLVKINGIWKVNMLHSTKLPQTKN